MAISKTIKDISVHVGDLVRVHVRIVEGEKERVQVYEGMVISIKGRGANQMFTVRKIASGNIGVERIFPVSSPWIAKIEIKKVGKTRRAKLYYVRAKSTRQVATITQGSN